MRDEAFFSWLEDRSRARPAIPLSDLLADAGGASRVAVLAVDLVQGFCTEGALASEPVGALVEPTVDFLQRAYQLGLRDFYFPCDAHPADSAEFASFPPHCIAGSRESELVRALQELPFSGEFRRFDKGSVSALLGTGLAEELNKGDFKTLVCCGDCTDLCLYHLAVGMRYYANQHGLSWSVVVPENLVATYDLPVEVAAGLGALPHPGPLLHELFLYHLELNGVEVVASLP